MRRQACRQWLCWLLAILALQLTVRADQIIYDDALENGWADWSWGTRSLTNASPLHSGLYSISANETAWQALSFFHTDFSTSPYTNLIFWINGGPVGGQVLQVQAELAQVTTSSNYPISALPSGSIWRQITIPLTALGVANANNFDRFTIQLTASGTTNAYYVDDISLQAGAPILPGTNAPVSIAVDAQANRHAISPLIYGVAFASSSGVLQDLNAPLHRSGGNGTTTYNWQINAWNHAADWYFESIADNPGTAGADGDSFIQESKSGGAQAMLTIPMIGWVAKLGPGRTILASYNTNKYGTQTATDPYLPTAGNGVSLATGLNITTNDPTDANLSADTNFQAGWVQHLTNQWGTATNGGLLYYIMDNEWSLWQSTHRDIHPVGPTMDEVLTDYCNYATMVKGMDPNALVAGPEEWSWPGYFYSGYDQQWSGANNDYNPADYPDRKAHGGQDFGPWFLTQVRLRSQASGQRLLDNFTLHCYPQENGVGGNAVDSATEVLRNQSTRQFWDTNYVDPSWINSIIALIPRMRSWVTTNYPGTKIGVTEYNWGAEPYINGATAQADIFGIFGREGLDLATRWETPDPSTPTYKAMKMYRNYDGNDSTFGNTSVAATVPNPDNLSAFAAIRTNDSAMTLMVINKDILNATPLIANIANFANSGTAQAWQLTSANVITRLADVPYANGVLSNTLPSQSINLFVLPTAKNLRLRVGTNAPPGQMELWMDGQGGQSYTLQSSANLAAWSAVSAYTFSSNSFRVLVSTTNAAGMFYRGLLNSP
ncbi:MAG: glycoside hydrolase family 44 protein [Verrucomicrobiia bacterium]